MRVYHGSYLYIETIDLSKARDFRDFGRGFYVTKIKSQAEFWAKRIGEHNSAESVITEFEFNTNAWCDKELNTLQFENYSEEWLDFVVYNRNEDNIDNEPKYDIVEGPVADDAISRRISNYLKNEISKQDFLKELTFFRPNHQIAFCTLKSLQMLRPLNKISSHDLEETSLSIITILMQEHNIDEIAASDILYTSKTFAELAEPNSDLSKKPWQEVYELLKKELGE
jgi:hypothetical protein